MAHFEIENDMSAKIKVIGCGGGGGNAINNMIQSRLSGVSFIAANTDAQDIEKSLADHTIQLGGKLTKGLGAGANPEVGRNAALESIDQVRELVQNTDMVFITAGMGGGTGTGAAPVIAQAAKEAGALTVAVVTKPFYFEGRRRMQQADKGIAELRQVVDSIITIPNDRLLQMAAKKAGFGTMLKKADEVLYYAVKGIADLITVHGLINLDFADVKAIMTNSGLALMGTGIASGENRAREAALKAITSPLLEDVSIAGARGVLFNITASEDMSTDEIQEVSDLIAKEAHEDANIVFGVVADPDAGDELCVTVIATSIDQREAAPKPEKETKPLLNPVPVAPKQGLRRTGTIASVIANSNRDLPAFVRANAVKTGDGRQAYASMRAMGAGEEEFLFEDEALDTPAFIRRNAD
ncbi:cell division protein FtsZ [Humidesulfovibrio mexicanus]|uniref:Cell division protein FtsZ n=1 Tax=Humidesulfovibrio mexicanus TaxID=147047 RepID=A0A238YVA2_9BACT|nr:cell division protein FtsZ [Humidesulfovibrio mexicanus]SNR75057.1 cell division protein FtsZ [Humidesulfovibrio mexicanus]